MITGFVAGFLIVATVLANGVSQGHVSALQAPQSSAAPTPTASPFPSQTVVTNGATIVFGDGTYQVGKDLPPGTYRASDPNGDCFWERLGPDMGTGPRVWGNNATASGTLVVTIEAFETFHSAYCGSWTNDLAPITASRTAFRDGSFIVGVDIEPGTYAAPGGDSCRWMLLSGFGGSYYELIKEDRFVTGAPTVTIGPSVKGFYARGCGRWTLQADATGRPDAFLPGSDRSRAGACAPKADAARSGAIR